MHKGQDQVNIVEVYIRQMHHVVHRAHVPVWCDSLPSFGIKATFLFV